MADCGDYVALDMLGSSIHVALKWLIEAIGLSQSKCANGLHDWCQRLELLVPGFGTRGTRLWHSWFQALEPTVSSIGTKIGTIVKNCQETSSDGFKCKIALRKSAGYSAG